MVKRNDAFICSSHPCEKLRFDPIFSANSDIRFSPSKSLLRELGEEFTYQAFLDRLRAKKRELQATQLNALKQRLDLLDAFVDKESTNRQKRYAPGRLTIIDLSDPFIDATSACSIFEILTRQFAREDVGTGKVLLVDEAHKVRSNIFVYTVLTIVYSICKLLARMLSVVLPRSCQVLSDSSAI